MTIKRALSATLLSGTLILGVGVSQAGELIYRPINPSFGGNPLLGNHLLNKAQAQDTKKDPNAPDFGGFSEVDFFIQDLRAGLVNDAIENALEDGPGRESTIDNSTLSIVIRSENSGFVMDILDKKSGETTTIRFGQPF